MNEQGTGPDVPATATQVALNLAKLTRELSSVVAAMESADRDAARARSLFDLEFSKAFLSAKGSVDARKHEAVVATHGLRDDAEVKEAVLRHLQRRIREIGTRIDVGRSYGAAVRSELAALPGTQ